MLQRLIIHLSLILLFAFTQIGVATHAISHLTGDNAQHQQDQNNHQNQCEQCLSYGHASVANLKPVFTFQVTPVQQVFALSDFYSSSSTSTYFYSARAPPTTSHT
jgi:hypothetical protein